MITDWISPTTMYGAILPAITSNGSTGVASSPSYVPRSRSRVIANAVIITIVNCRITASNPGTMLYSVTPSGL